MNDETRIARLEELLREPIEAVVARERTTFDVLAAPLGDALVLFGAGGLGRKTLAGLRALGLEPLAFADNNRALWGTMVQGVPVLSLREAAHRFGQSAVFVVTIWKGEAVDRMEQRCQELRTLGCARVVSFAPLYWKYPDVFMPHYAFDAPHKAYAQGDKLRQTLALWADSASQDEYLAQLAWRMRGDFDGLAAPVEHTIYFPDDLVEADPQEVFVDCGAYDGDTLDAFLARQENVFGHVFAFEPDAANFAKLQTRVGALPRAISERISMYPYAVGARREQVRFDAQGTEASAMGSGALWVDCVTLDGLVMNANPTYLKMDIEGAELDALAGARAVIARHLPVLAICAYHRQDHLWEIPLFIHSISDQYRFFLRPHLLEVWDLVCYAVPITRLKQKCVRVDSNVE